MEEINENLDRYYVNFVKPEDVIHIPKATLREQDIIRKCGWNEIYITTYYKLEPFKCDPQKK